MTDELMLRYPGLMRRPSGIYYLRTVVPDDLRRIIEKGEIWRSLKTRDRAEAVRLAKLGSIEIDLEFSVARKKASGGDDRISDADVERLAAMWLNHLMTEDEEARRSGMTDRAFDSVQETLDIVSPADAAALARGDLERMEFEIQEFLSSQGFELSPDTEAFKRVGYAFLKANVKATDMMITRQKGYVVDTPPLPNALTLVGGSDGYAISQLIDDYMADPSHSRTLSTEKTYRTAFRALKELLGSDTPLKSIHRRDCERIRDTIARLPRNASQRYPGMPLQDVARIADAEGLVRIKAGTVNAYLTNLSSLFRWAVKSWRMERNPAEGLQVHNAVADVDQKRPFTADELKVIFSAPIYTGCRDDEQGYGTPGPNVVRRGRFWIPLLSLWTGMRLGECCQLHVSDVDELDGVPCILIQDSSELGEDEEDKRRVKTAAGRRFVPVHPELQKIGFLKFVGVQRAKKTTRLFPEVKPDSQGYLSGTFSKWFNDRRRFLGKLGIAGRGASFHSFRHNYRDALREAEISLERVRALGGWRRDSGGEEARYGAGLKASTLYEDIKRVTYPGLDLSFLYVEKGPGVPPDR